MASKMNPNNTENLRRDIAITEHEVAVVDHISVRIGKSILVFSGCFDIPWDTTNFASNRIIYMYNLDSEKMVQT